MDLTTRALKLSTPFIFIFALLAACESSEKKGEAKLGNPGTQLQQGEQLARQHCSACHLYPEPGLLNKESWANVLPAMKAEMEKSRMPMRAFDWMAVQEYYLKTAPDALKQPAPETLTEPAGNFKLTEDFTGKLPGQAAATLVKYDSTSHQLFVGDAAGSLYITNKEGQTKSIRTVKLPVDVQADAANSRLLVLGLGNLFPSEEMNGTLVSVGAAGNQQTVIDSLERPVQFELQDFNADGRAEILISSFGSTKGPANTGKLSLFCKQGNDYREKVIKASPGATKAVVGDFNQDGKPDVMALFAQGHEFISLFLNKGNFDFEEKQLLEFPPVYGANSFDLADVNGDSHPDIVFTNGDNSDYSTVFKPYHGVRIFLNNGRNEYTQEYFFHINGASKVLARDFDSDGDLDLMVLAMFPNLAFRPQETLVYLQNNGSLQFAPSYLEKLPSAKWLLMDAGDIDQDGDDDIVVGANEMITLPVPARLKQTWQKHSISFAVFQNEKSVEPQQGFWESLLRMVQ